MHLQFFTSFVPDILHIISDTGLLAWMNAVMLLPLTIGESFTNLTLRGGSEVEEMSKLS